MYDLDVCTYCAVRIFLCSVGIICTLCTYVNDLYKLCACIIYLMCKKAVNSFLKLVHNSHADSAKPHMQIVHTLDSAYAYGACNG
jgi:hypothetical protein